MLATHGPHWVYHSPRWHVLPRSTLLRLQGALQMYSVEWTLLFMLFPGLCCSGSQVLCKGTDSDGLCFMPFPGPSSSGNRCLASTIPSGPRISCTFLVPTAWFLRCVMCLLWGADLRLKTSWQMWAIQNPRNTWLATGSLLTIWWRCSLWGWDCSSPLLCGSGCWTPASLPLGREGSIWQLDYAPLVFTQSFVSFAEEVFLFCFVLFCFLFFVFWSLPSHALNGYLTLAPSHCPQGIQPGPYSKEQWCSPRLPAQLPLTAGRHEYLWHFSASRCT